MALLILALLQRIFLMSSLMLLLVWLIFFMVLIKLLPILGTISGKDRKSGSAGMPRPSSYAVFCLKKKIDRCLLRLHRAHAPHDTSSTDAQYQRYTEPR